MGLCGRVKGSSLVPRSWARAGWQCKALASRLHGAVLAAAGGGSAPGSAPACFVEAREVRAAVQGISHVSGHQVLRSGPSCCFVVQRAMMCQ